MKTLVYCWDEVSGDVTEHAIPELDLTQDPWLVGSLADVHVCHLLNDHDGRMYETSARRLPDGTITLQGFFGRGKVCSLYLGPDPAKAKMNAELELAAYHQDQIAAEEAEAPADAYPPGYYEATS